MGLRTGARSASWIVSLALAGCAALAPTPRPTPAAPSGEPAPLDASDTKTTRTFLDLAAIREDAGDWDGALARVDKALAYQPRSRSALLRRAQILLLGASEREDLEEPREILERVGEPQDGELIVARAWLASAEGEREAAVAGAHDALAGGADSARVQWLAARLLTAQGEAAAANDAADRALALDPGSGAARRERARARLRRADVTEAILDLGDHFRRHGDDAEARALEGELFHRIGDSASARHAYERIPAARRDASATAALAQLQIQAGDLAAARALLEPAVGTQPTDVHLLEAMWLLDGREGRADSLARIDAACAARPEDAALARLRARALAAQRSDEAGAAFARAIALDPNDTSAYQLLAAWLATAGDAERRVLALGLDPAPAQVALGFLHTERGDHTGAIAAHQKAVETDAGLPIARAALARSLTAAERDPERALTLAREASAARPSDPDFAWTLGLAHAQRGQYKASYEALRLAIGSYPIERRGYPELVWNTAQVLDRYGDRVGASRAAKVALALASQAKVEPSWRRHAQALAEGERPKVAATAATETPKPAPTTESAPSSEPATKSETVPATEP